MDHRADVILVTSAVGDAADNTPSGGVSDSVVVGVKVDGDDVNFFVCRRPEVFSEVRVPGLQGRLGPGGEGFKVSGGGVVNVDPNSN